MGALLLVRYGELALKSPPVRREFERSLRRNILAQLLRDGVTGRLRADRGHLYVESDDPERALRVLRRVFGVTSVSEAHEVPTDRATIRARLLELASPRLPHGASFAVRARRTGQHPFTSQQLAAELGEAVLESFVDRALTVDLERPDVELHVEVRANRTYLYFDRASGPGGLPLGVAGRLVALVDGRRGALGAFLMMKRGCRVSLVVLPDAEPLVDGTLARFDPAVNVLPSPPDVGSWSSAIATEAERSHADGVVLPIGVDDYATAKARWGDRVLFSPTVGLSDEEVSERWRNVTALAG